MIRAGNAFKRGKFELQQAEQIVECLFVATVWRCCQQHQVPFNVTLEVGGWEVIKRYVELDFGVSIVTGICLREDDKLVAKNMSDYFPRRSYGTVMRRGKYLSSQARAFLDVTEEASLPDSPWSSSLAG